MFSSLRNDQKEHKHSIPQIAKQLFDFLYCITQCDLIGFFVCMLMILMFSLIIFFIRSCLQLITDCPPAIQEELDLINALGQLEDFSVNILPLQGSKIICASGKMFRNFSA